MAGSRPENPDADVNDLHYPETVPDADHDDDPTEGYEPGTELLPEKGDFHKVKPTP